MNSNQEGLQVLVSGQPLVNGIQFNSFPFGGYKVTVEVYRGPTVYDYTSIPITFFWTSQCDGNIFATIALKPAFLKECAKVEFHQTFKTFNIGPSS